MPARAALVAGLLIGLAACGSDSTGIDVSGGASTGSPSASATDDSTVLVSTVVDTVTKQFQRRMGISASIKCGDDVEWTAPSRHQCIIGGEEVQAIAIVNIAEDGSITWRVQ